MNCSIKKIFIFLGILGIPLITCAQTLTFRNYTGREDLPAPSSRCITQDSKGYIWIGTRDGLARFDGLEFKKFTEKDGLEDNYITTITEDHQGTLWFGTLRAEVYRFSGGRFTRQLSLREVSKKKQMGNFLFSSAEDRDGILWFGTEEGLCRYDGENLKTFTIADGLNSSIIKDIAVGEDGKLWLGTPKGLSCFTGSGFTNYTTVDGLINNNVKVVMPDSKGKIWIGTSGGLSCFHKDAFESYTTKHGLSDNIIRAIEEDRFGNIWFGTWEGVTLFTGKEFRTISTENGLIDNFVFTIFQDREGNMWFGTGSGVSRLRTLNIETYSKKNGLASNGIGQITEDKEGQIWISTHNGVNCLSRGTIKTYTTKNGLIRNAVNALMEDRTGKIWIATIEGVSVFSSGKFTNYTVEDGLSNNIVYKICEGRDGAIWFGTLQGISRFDSKIGRFSSVPFDSKNLKVESLIEDKKGNLWFSSEKGLYRYNGKVLDCFTTEQGLPANVIHSFLEDSKGNLWIGTKGGISCFKDGKFTNYTTADGLPHNKCNFFVEDRRGNLWLGTVNGLCFFDGTTFTTYTAKKHELATDYWETGFIDSQGYIWLGSGEGVTRFLPPPLRPNIVPPPIHFTTVKVLEKEIPLSRLHQLSHDQNYIRFEFKGLCYSSPETVRYKYFLEGIDKNWKETKNPSIFYYLPHGKYRFKVKAVNYDGVESTVPAAVSFRIHPAFWQTWWFKALMVWLVLFIMGLLFLWRYKQAKAKTELRARTHQLVMAQRMELMGTLASGTVHDLKNLLIVIISVAQVMGQTYDKEDKNYKHIEIIEDTTKTAMHMAKQILSFARYNSDQVPGNADLVYLLMEIIKTLELTSPKSVAIKPILSPKPIMFPIHPARFQQLVMNLCLNAVQAMPQGGELNITIAYSDEETIRLDIGDTGSGISPSLTGKIFEPLFTTKGQEDGTGLGLFVVKQVVTEHNGTIDVHSEPGKTTFTIRFPALSST